MAIRSFSQNRDVPLANKVGREFLHHYTDPVCKAGDRLVPRLQLFQACQQGVLHRAHSFSCWVVSRRAIRTSKSSCSSDVPLANKGGREFLHHYYNPVCKAGDRLVPRLQLFQACQQGVLHRAHSFSCWVVSRRAIRTSKSSCSSDLPARSRMHWAARARTDTGLPGSTMIFNSTATPAPEFC